MASEWLECNNGLKVLRARIPDGRPPEVRKMLVYANTLKGLLMKENFLRCLKDWALSAEDIENLLCVMQRYPKYALNEQQMKWLDEYWDSLNVPNGEIEQAKYDFKLKYGDCIPEVEKFFVTLKTISGSFLKKVYRDKVAMHNVSLKAFVEDCVKIVPERKYENDLKYGNILKLK